LLAKEIGEPLIALSAVMSGVADLREAFKDARKQRARGRRPILFIDEIHRFNRAQQDGLLHEVEDGTVTLIGATTENPSFALVAALLSRCLVVVLSRLSDEALLELVSRAESHLGHRLPLTDAARRRLAELADGDGRYLVNMVETLADLPPEPVLDVEALADLLQQRLPVYDRQQEAHYNIISALHKSVRGSDPDAALYWLCRMLEGGEDPRYIARRLIRMASEDIGLADPQALPLAIAAAEAYERLGSPEGELALAQCTIHLAAAPKSNAAYLAYGAAGRSAKEHGSLMPPAHILNAPTKLMKKLGYGKGYEYDHEAPERFSGQSYFPEGMERATYYRPTGEGIESRVKARLERLAELRKERDDG
jgi:putative ATPase